MAKSEKKILIVEDNAVQSMMMERFFKELHHQVVSVVDRGEKAVTKARTLNPDLIIMDIFLNGDMTGIQAMKEIRKKSQVPVIYISGNSDPFYRKQARKTDFADFFYKPVNHTDLQQSVEQVFGKNGTSNKKWFWPFGLFV